MSNGYNGWKNYETWNVALWIDNERGSYQESRQLLRDMLEHHELDLTSDDDKATAIREGADALKEYVTEYHVPDLGASMAGDLLGAALSEVDWDEIAENFLDELAE